MHLKNSKPAKLFSSQICSEIQKVQKSSKSSDFICLLIMSSAFQHFDGFNMLNIWPILLFTLLLWNHFDGFHSKTHWTAGTAIHRVAFQVFWLEASKLSRCKKCMTLMMGVQDALYEFIFCALRPIKVRPGSTFDKNFPENLELQDPNLNIQILKICKNPKFLRFLIENLKDTPFTLNYLPKQKPLCLLH